MIATGEIADGERIAEIPTAEMLGVSRMPVRTALRALALEGLVVPLGARGFAARRASRAELEGAVQVRGVLEGLAARLAAEHPDHAIIGAELTAIITPCANLFGDTFDEASLTAYFEMNRAFHDRLVVASGNTALATALAHNSQLPLGSAGAFAFDVGDSARTIALLARAHGEHERVAGFIRDGEAGWAEEAMRRHAQVSLAVEIDMLAARADTPPEGADKRHPIRMPLLSRPRD